MNRSQIEHSFSWSRAQPYFRTEFPEGIWDIQRVIGAGSRFRTRIVVRLTEPEGEHLLHELANRPAVSLRRR